MRRSWRWGGRPGSAGAGGGGAPRARPRRGPSFAPAPPPPEQGAGAAGGGPLGGVPFVAVPSPRRERVAWIPPPHLYDLEDVFLLPFGARPALLVMAVPVLAVAGSVLVRRRFPAGPACAGVVLA